VKVTTKLNCDEIAEILAEKFDLPKGSAMTFHTDKITVGYGMAEKVEVQFTGISFEEDR